MRFGPDSGGSSTQAVKDPWSLLRTAATSVGVDPNDAVSYAQGTGTDPKAAISDLPGLFATMQSSPGATIGEAAARSGKATPAQSATIDNVSKEKKGGTADQSGLVSDIFGSIFEVIYPWLMLAFANVLVIVGMATLLVALIKSPAGNLSLGFAGPVGKGLGLIGKGL